MAHYLDHVVASDRSFEVLKRRALKGELGPCALDSSNQKLHAMGGHSIFDGYMADREGLADSYQGEALKFVAVEAAAFGKRK